MIKSIHSKNNDETQMFVAFVWYKLSLFQYRNVSN